MTEQEAREKWCPMARVPIASEAYLNSTTREFNCFCIASDCAMWVWEDKLFFNPDTNKEEKDEGHCGLIRGNK